MGGGLSKSKSSPMASLAPADPSSFGSNTKINRGASFSSGRSFVLKRWPTLSSKSFFARTTSGAVDIKAKAVAEDWINQSVRPAELLLVALLEHFDLDGVDETLQQPKGGSEFMDCLVSSGPEDLNAVVTQMSERLRDRLQLAVDEAKRSLRGDDVSDARDAISHAATTSKFDVWAGETNDETVSTAKFATLSAFYSGLDARIGIPHPRVLETMEYEHIYGLNADLTFTSSNYGGITTTPAIEWQFAFDPDFQYTYPCSLRKPQALSEFLSKDETKRAGLTKEEVLALRLYTGPMFFLYNCVLRQWPEALFRKVQGNRYTTTIHTIVSAIIKLSRIGELTKSRRVYRGISGVILPDSFWSPDEFGCRGGVETAIMSCTTRREVAVRYSFYRGKVATVMEIEIGQVDRGASLSWVSQFPGENELVMPPLSNLEVVGRPRMEFSKAGRILVIPMRVSVNVKCLTLEELIARRQLLHLDMIKALKDECRLLIKASHDSEPQNNQEEGLGEFTTQAFLFRRKDPNWFNIDQNYRSAINTALDLREGFEVKWSLQHNPEILADQDLSLRIADTSALKFADMGFIHVLRSGTEEVPWGPLLGGLTTCRVPMLSYHQSNLAWEVFQSCLSTLQTLQIENSDGNMIELHVQDLLDAEKVSLKDMKLGKSFLMVAPSFAMNSLLRSLILRGNRIGDSGAVLLSQSLKLYTALTELDLGDNGISAAGSTVMSLHLTVLTQLLVLNMTLNPLDDAGVVAISFALPSLTSLVSVDFSWIRFTQEGVLALTRALQKLKSLQSIELFPGYFLDLRGQSIWEDERLVAQELAAMIKCNPQLRSITLSGCQSDVISEAVSGALALCEGLDVYFAAMNNLSFKGSMAAARFLQKHTKLKVVAIAWDWISTAWLASLSETMELRSLFCISCRFGQGGLEKFSQSLSIPGRVLITLMLTCPIVQFGTLEEFLRDLRLPMTLKHLDLSSCEIKEAWAANLSKSLDSCSSLTLLNLRDNKIGPSGTEALSKVLRQNEGLTELNLSGNEIQPAGASALCHGLECSVLLKKLDLSFNSLFEEGCLALIPVIQTCTNLTFLSLRSNKVLRQSAGEKSGLGIWGLLDLSYVPTEVNLNDNQIDEFTVSRFKRVFENKRHLITNPELPFDSIIAAPLTGSVRGAAQPQATGLGSHFTRSLRRMPN